MERDRLTRQEVIPAPGEEFLGRYGAGLPAAARRTLRDVVDGRTAALGGPARRGIACGHVEVP